MTAAASRSTTVERPLSFMEKLGPLVSLYRPSDVSLADAGTQPRLVIISNWTDARDSHIAKYVVKYQALYPAAQLLLLRSTMDCIVRRSQIGPAMRVAASVVRDIYQTPVEHTDQPLLVHMFSNGGSSSIANLYEQFAITAGPNDSKQFPPHVNIFDSCPGLFRIPRAVAFVSVDLPSYQQLIAAPFLYALAAFWTISMALGVLPDTLDNWYSSHNNHLGNTSEIRRVYIYSPTDTLIDYKDVELHAAEAKTKGFSVELVEYKDSAHVAHLRQDENRYWGSIAKAMER